MEAGNKGVVARTGDKVGSFICDTGDWTSVLVHIVDNAGLGDRDEDADEDDDTALSVSVPSLVTFL